MTLHASHVPAKHLHLRAAALAAVTATLLLGAATEAGAEETPAQGAHKAATAPATLDTLSRFFARDGAVTRSAAAPRVQNATVPVHTLSAAFVAGTKGAAASKLDFMATTAVSSDGQKASLWMAPQDGAWKVVNIATGDDETRYAAAGARALPGGTVFREPQIDAWYVHDATRVLPLDEDATSAVGAKGTTLAAYQSRVHKAYADKLPGTAYAKQGKAGGYGAPAGAAAGNPAPDGGALSTPAAAGGAAVLLAAAGLTAVRLRRRKATQA
ncbi:hypothetical protein OG897_10850 [Streptomyces sp. NBC_00237]|uniref:hypothetical protein n=1 Tax=Streptomyces sp. NBC_00237 TaxID=2975687 RepID=UPI002256687B|nr:hypothetical protein [Streptomyces sp. NBC_00237]MCX5201947.1 hypothetical protein [Streptomyces sp. NBC_00237]